MGKLRFFAGVFVVMTFLLVTVGNTSAAPVETNLYGLSGMFLGTESTTVPVGTVAVGASMLVISDDNADGSTLPVSVTYGATDFIEIAAAFEAYKSYDGPGGDETGNGDLFLSGKFVLQEENADYPGVAAGLRLKLPMADEPLSTEETDFAIFAALQMNMKGVTGILNVEYLLPGGDYNNQVNYVVGVRIPYSETTDFTVELIDNDLVGDMLAGGATFDMGSSLNFGAAVGVGLEEDTSADFAVQGKLTFVF